MHIIISPLTKLVKGDFMLMHAKVDGLTEEEKVRYPL